MFCSYLRTNSGLCHLQHKLIGFITEMKSVYCAVRTGSLNKAVCASSLKLLTEYKGNIIYLISFRLDTFCKGNSMTCLCRHRAGEHVQLQTNRNLGARNVRRYGKDLLPIVQESGWTHGRSGQTPKISPPTGFESWSVETATIRYID